MKLYSYCSIYSVLALTWLGGCGGSSSTPNTPPAPAIGQIYVTKGTGTPIVHFRAGDNGDVAPQQEIGVPARPFALSLDVAHNRLAATSFDGPPIVVLIDNASSPSTAARLISGAATTMRGPGSCALDGAADVLYVADTGSVPAANAILAFGPASTASGNIAPLRTIIVPYFIAAVVVDPANNRLFVADSTNNAINIYDSASTLSGAVVPSRSVSGPATQFSSIGALAFESSGHLVAASSSTPNVWVFNNAGVANGNVAPSASFTLAPSGAAQMAVTPAGDLYVTEFAPEIRAYVNIFAASGTITPVRIITGPHTDLDTNFRGIPPLVVGIAIDPTR
jgi:DNA-binding beta-propeller fold protein YncE